MSGPQRRREPLGGGWDSRTYLVDGRWIEREPRRPAVEAGLRTETRLMPWLAPSLPLQVPVPRVVSERPLVVRHRRIRGAPIERLDETTGRRFGQFLLALHARPVDDAVGLGVPDREQAVGSRARLLTRLRADVLGLLPGDLVAAGSALLDRVADYPIDTLVHGDLGPAHLLVHVGRLHGVIDWTDTGLGDAALDLSWGLHGSSAPFAAGVGDTYGVDPATSQRARDWHLLGPWHEVLHGVDTQSPAFVSSWLAGAVARLSAESL